MSYNPGNQNISGQLLAQGISQAGQALAEGIQQFRQNKKDAAAANSTLDLLLPFAQKAGATVDPDMLSKFHKAGLTSKQAMLGQLATNITLTMRQAAADREDQRLAMEEVNNAGAARLRDFQLQQLQQADTEDAMGGKILADWARDNPSAATPASPTTSLAPYAPAPGAVDLAGYSPMTAPLNLPAASASPGVSLAQYAPAPRSAKLATLRDYILANPDLGEKSKMNLLNSLANQNAMEAHADYYRTMPAARAARTGANDPNIGLGTVVPVVDGSGKPTGKGKVQIAPNRWQVITLSPDIDPDAPIVVKPVLDENGKPTGHLGYTDSKGNHHIFVPNLAAKALANPAAAPTNSPGFWSGVANWFQGPANTPAAATSMTPPANTPAAAPPAGATVEVIRPDGKIFKIPSARLSAYEANGWKLHQ